MPSGDRVKFHLIAGEPAVTIRARRTGEFFLLLFVLVAVIPAMELFLITEAVPKYGGLWSVAFAFVIFPAFGFIVLYSLMWQHSGEEIVTIAPPGLLIRRKIYGRGNESSLENVDPDSLKLSSVHAMRRVSGLMFWRLPWQRAIQLKSNGRRRLIGNDLSSEEAEEVIRFIREHLAN